MKFSTDKVGHGFLPTYLKMATMLGIQGRVLEIGVANGASLDMWQAFFPHGLVVGVDLSPTSRWPDGTVRVVADQTDPNLADHIHEAVWSTFPLEDVHNPPPLAFDLIVDDASHEGKATEQTFHSCWPLLRPGGWYVIEDWYVGFDTWPSYDGSMLQLATDMLHTVRLPLGEELPAVDSVEYRYGQIILRKGVWGDDPNDRTPMGRR